MQKLNKIYRANYGGERITTEAAFRNSEWLYKTEWIPTAVANNHISKIATVIGNGNSRKTFPIGLVVKHLSGRLGATSMQTYGCNALYREYQPTFLVTVGDDITNELAQSGYCDRHIVYANSDKIIRHPNKFYLIPQDFISNAGTIATYLACFDGHEKVYLIGFDNSVVYDCRVYFRMLQNAFQRVKHNYSDDYWIMSMERIMRMYNEVEFVRVTSTPNYVCPPSWSKLPNFRQIHFQAYLIEADIGVT